MEHNNLSLLDITCKKMVIDAAWLYDENLDDKKLFSSLSRLALIYPILTGKIEKDVVSFSQNGVRFSYKDSKKSINSLIRGYRLGKSYQAKFNKKKLLYSVKLTNLRDGAVLSIKASHAIMDGYAFYKIASNLMSLYRGEEISDILSFDNRFSLISLPDKIDQSLFFPLSKEDKKAFFKSFLKRKKMSVIHLEKDFINELSADLGVSKTSAILAHLYALNGRKKMGFVLTANHRPFVNALGCSYMKNASSTLYPIELEEGLSAEVAAKTISKELRSLLEKDEIYFASYLKMLEEKSLSSLPFPLSRAYGKNRDLLIVNSFLPFELYDSMRAEKAPIFSFPPSLSDPVRLFPCPDGSVDIIFLS